MIALFFRNSEIRIDIFLCMCMFLISGCTQLEGILPKIKPQVDEETSKVTHSPSLVAAKQQVLTDENRKLHEKIGLLEQQLKLLEKQQKKTK